jgi:hypothetical protein
LKTPQQISQAAKRLSLGEVVDVSTLGALRQVEGNALPRAENLEAFGSKVLESTPEEWTQIHGGELTKRAYELGLAADSPEYVSKLKELGEQASAKFKEALAAGDLDTGFLLANK